jgi:hypoxanthine phosphoribosyltransferase
MLTAAEARRTLESAELIVSADAVSAAVRRVADEISVHLSNAYPLVLSVMGGAVVFTGSVLPLLRFPLEFDYLHVTRYGDATSGGELRWIAAPRESIAGRTVLVLDDILDEGITLSAIRQRMLDNGAAACFTAVFADKDIGRPKPIKADFVGLRLPNRYVFGFGMDVKGAWRNLPEIYALPVSSN